MSDGSVPIDASGAAFRDWRGRWLVGVVLAPVIGTLAAVLWQTPMPLSEGVALLEDAVLKTPLEFLSPRTSYYRPIYHLTLAALWNHAPSTTVALASIRLMQIVPLLVLVGLFVSVRRPAGVLAGASVLFGVAVLLGSSGLRDNLEIPLSYSLVGMPAVLAIWIIVERPYRAWHGPAVVALAALAVGFKEQGLVCVPVVVIAWWLGAPGIRRGAPVVLVVLSAVYVVARLAGSETWPLFQQDVGFGFARLSPAAAEARFGDAPWWVFAYSGGATMANVLFSEPTGGVFRVTESVWQGRPLPLEMMEVTSSVALTALCAWWAWGVLGRVREYGWTVDSRLLAGFAVALVASGALSVNYSRDRLGAMAVPFYAMVACAALHTMARTVSALSAGRRRLWGAALVLLVAVWQLRVIGTLERARENADNNRREWLMGLAGRRLEFEQRGEYLRIMERLVEQGTDEHAPRPTRSHVVLESP